MAQRLVRCIEGHVFDVSAMESCPVCGSGVAQGAPKESAPHEDVSITMVAAGASEVAARARDGFAAAARTLDLGGKVSAISKVRLPPQAIWAGGGAVLAAIAVFLFLHRTPANQAPTVEATHSASVASTTQPPTKPNQPRSLPAQTTTALSTPSTTTATTPSNNETTSQSSTGSPQISAVLTTALTVTKMFNTANGRDYDGAVTLASDLVKANNPRGGFLLGLMHANGTGVAKDEAKARQYFAWATRLGDAEAALVLAKFLEKGIGGPVDNANAKILYTYAARNSVPNADKEMGRLHLDIGGTILEAYNELAAGENVQRATQFLDTMFANHSGLSYCAVGWLYLRGKTVAVDLAKASEDLRAGAERGFSWCALGMGQLAATGAPGIPKNLIEARIWYAFGKAFGILGQQSADVDRQIAEVEAQMSPQDLQTARYLYNSMTTPRSPVN